MPPKETPDKREELARDYADAIPDDADYDDAEQNDDYEPTYRDGSLKNECWDDRGYRDNSDWRDE